MKRWLPHASFPAYTFVPGRTPRHREEDRAISPVALTEANWREHEEYLRGLDLYAAGYYWEAHEAWEAAWNSTGRVGRICDFLKALIKLAAAGVKIYEGSLSGFENHVRRCLELLDKLCLQGDTCLGVDLPSMAGWLREHSSRFAPRVLDGKEPGLGEPKKGAPSPLSEDYRPLGPQPCWAPLQWRPGKAP